MKTFLKYLPTIILLFLGAILLDFPDYPEPWSWVSFFGFLATALGGALIPRSDEDDIFTEGENA